MIQFSKPKYPDKQTINLVVKEADKVDVRIQLVGFALFLVCLGVLVKFAVIARLNVAEEAKRTYMETKQQIQVLEERTKEYSKLHDVYSKLNNKFFSESEAAEIDRMEIIDMVEDCVLDRADMESINITGNQVVITIVDTTLASVSEVVAALQADERIAYVTVSTAGTGRAEQLGKNVSADIMLQLKNGGEK